MSNNENRDSGIHAVGQLIATVAALVWEIFRPKNENKRE